MTKRDYPELTSLAQNLKIGRVGSPGGSAGKESLQCRRPQFDSWVGKIRWRRERLPIPVSWPGECHGLCSPWGRRVGHDWAAFPHSLGVTHLKKKNPRCHASWYREAPDRMQQPPTISKSFRKLQLKRSFFNKTKTINKQPQWKLEEGKDVRF